jgi:aspartyl-tRNA(Asn)/glutamyl-tRNA(Gln) amidotransferase subunit A
MGSDGGGSIRIPAASCGVYGLKPSPGLIPFDNRTNAFGRTTHYLVQGPLTRTVADAALLLSVTCGPSPSDPLSTPVERDYRAATTRSISDLRVAYSPDLDGFDVDDEVSTVVEAALETFEHAGASVETVTVDHGYEIAKLADAIEVGWAAEVAAGVELLEARTGVDVRTHPDTADSLLLWLEKAEGVGYTEVARTAIPRTDLFLAVQSLFETYDLLVTPTLGRVGIDLHQGATEHLEWLRTATLTWPFNLTGHPAASVPVGFTDDGLPVGMQVVGRWYEDDTVLAASAAVERERPWHDTYPY